MASELVNFVTVKYRNAILYQLLSILCNHALSSPTLPDFNWIVYLNFIWPILIKCNVKIHVDIKKTNNTWRWPGCKERGLNHYAA